MFQETLIKVWNALSRYNERQKFSSWLFTIAHNVAIDILRKRKNVNKEINFGEYVTVENSKNPEELLIRDETMVIINTAVENLTEKQKTVFLLRQHGDLSFKEIAETTGEPLNTVLSHMRYAIKKVRKKIEEKNEYRKTATL
jgi:RNA polymerase sigma-70 factor (ECF subfamily)